MPVRRSLQLLDTLVLPVSQYCSEVITPLSLPGKSFDCLDALLKSWEQYAPEKIQQRMCRMILSVQKKSSRLAVLGELGKYPVLLKGLTQCITYEWHVKHRTASDSLVRLAYYDMVEMGNRGICDSWVSRVDKIKKYFNIPEFASSISPLSISKQVKNAVQSKFDIFWLKEINKMSLDENGVDHNKLRFYKSFKGSFKMEPYLESISNRNQRCHLTRIHISVGWGGIRMPHHF